MVPMLIYIIVQVNNYVNALLWFHPFPQRVKTPYMSRPMQGVPQQIVQENKMIYDRKSPEPWEIQKMHVDKLIAEFKSANDPDWIEIEKFRQREESTIYINTYETNRAYGGPEEGGWWFDIGDPVESVQFDFSYQARYALPEFEERWMKRNKEEERKRPSSVNCDGWYETYLEDKFAESYPKQKPHYE